MVTAIERNHDRDTFHCVATKDDYVTIEKCGGAARILGFDHNGLQSEVMLNEVALKGFINDLHEVLLQVQSGV